ncbi:response regulator transcription factor [Simiaoa sunii]|jgi:two-component system response regulator YesN|uniref:Stage 0 sporulation protein A homolog n=1 Tax=Simiaoa sunii TaxID=2763672 RepID=A0A7G9FV04_9FIRM|nr:response regulator [Simiaoa sunii]QNM02386.1 response regulator [Simiaoa sunii]
MYKVVIIDDEPLIVEGLSRSIPWERWNCKVVGFGYNGIEGMEVIRREKPAIVISDISMPKMDGLTMIAGLKSEFPYMQVSILTGYREFTYAQEAIRLGVSAFLLKPSKMDELYEAIENMTEKLKLFHIEEEQPEAVTEEAEEEDSVLYNSEANNFVVTKALEYIKEHSRERIQLADVADHCYVSQWHLSKLLNKHTGENFSVALNKARIAEAKELLQDPSRRIYDIAEEVGFQDLAHFSRVFKKLEGISANEYRNTLS